MKNLSTTRDWLDQAKPGDELVYYRSYEPRKNKEVFALLAEAEEGGDVALFQKAQPAWQDEGERYFAYIARRLSSRAAIVLDDLSKAAKLETLNHA